ncbi:MAG: alanine--tRNA ligase [Candidatus Peribacter sp.]|nr:alanine--tRNA ligase [Candidatus Peribacter sp.]MBT4392983.1 alanine--tRNA ligase [Candidatus Peribacter sp.]MBT4601043.1 alanine--tRNA ligase [Candidatus Peribacter sp.]MBT5149595.1 alanine--tRNA ligase [Candidatus Peribacter sp.]MBT5637469.1 alanine--tRNA ligase [Candidatus Peribacter sp.]
MSTDDIRQAFLDFFQSRDHAVVPGASLVPENDPTVLFTTAGMHPLVPYLIGEAHPAGKRLVDAQRCIRTGDIDEVGDASHLTMFEMMGNWSLGDYFKEEAISMSFEFLTQVLGIDPTMLSVTCFEGDNDAPKDEEAAQFWMNVGIPEDRIGFLPKKENWWGPAGLTGPCGPDTEMFYWVGDGEPHGNPEKNDSDWMEIWNDVFMQYNKTESGQFEPLAQQNVDTGMGLERVAAMMQGVSNVYETDRMLPIIERVRSLASSSDLKHERIVTDHIKAATFMIADGIKPGNVDQAYVLRKVIRRAIRSAKQLGIESTGTLCAQISDEVVSQYGHIYGHVKSQEKMIADTLASEEQQFNKTLQAGLKQLEKVIAETSGNVIAGKDAFHLYDTYGFPLELTKEILEEKGYSITEKEYEIAFKAHQELSRKGAEQKFAGGLADHSAETTKLHTATHLLNAALRIVLGDHIYQKGSNITQERLRFDFSHDEKMTAEQKQEVERLVNEAIDADHPISFHVTDVEGAKDEGAIGVFDAKYDSEVKVYTMGDFSKEICGGPHVARTGMLGHFTLKKEESSSSGVRRIKATVEGGPEEIEVASQTS